MTIKAVYPIVVSPAGRYQWAFVNVITSEPGLYGLGSASVSRAFIGTSELISIFHSKRG